MADSDIVLLTRRDYNRLLAAAERIESLSGEGKFGPHGGSIGSPRRRAIHPTNPPRLWITAKLTSAYSTGYSWEEYAENDDGTLTAVSGGLSSASTSVGAKAFELNASQSVPINTYVRLYLGRDPDNGNPAVTFAFGGARGLFKVTVSQVGGSNGNASAAPTWTYNVTDPDTAASLGSAMTPEVPRYAIGPHTAATIGYGQYDASGTFHLVQVHEPRSGQRTCP